MSLDWSLYTEVDLGEKSLTSLEVFSYNITHNLNTMADESLLYELLWRPEENGYVYAKSALYNLTMALESLKGDPEYYKEFEPESKWGTYGVFVEAVEAILAACERYPKARIHACA